MPYKAAVQRVAAQCAILAAVSLKKLFAEVRVMTATRTQQRDGIANV